MNLFDELNIWFDSADSLMTKLSNKSEVVGFYIHVIYDLDVNGQPMEVGTSKSMGMSKDDLLALSHMIETDADPLEANQGE